MIEKAVWDGKYEDVGRWVGLHAPSAPPVIMVTSANIDCIYRLSADALDKLVAWQKKPANVGARVAAQIVTMIRNGQDAELYIPWAGGSAWMEEVLGNPDICQVGGTGLQAAWALAVLGATAVVSLRNRSPLQLGVMHPRIRVCEGRRVVDAGDAQPSGDGGVKRHYVLEFSRGTCWSRGRIDRSGRVIVRFGAVSVEHDWAFRLMQPQIAARAGAGLVSGLNGIAPEDLNSVRYIAEAVEAWEYANVGARHVELGDSGTPEKVLAVLKMLRGRVTSVGVSLSELRKFVPRRSDIAAAAVVIAEIGGVGCVYVHADGWSAAVYREGAASFFERQLMVGNLLAAARAEDGEPKEKPFLSKGCTYVEDRPKSGAWGAGWTMQCVPSPYVASPRSTIGLGDTFVAGVLLVSSLAKNGVPWWD